MTLNDVLKKNRHLKNIHSGRRCFLVGNGPSIKTQDITRLKDEVAIVATSFFRHPDAKAINPSYWVFADPQYWKNPEQYFTSTFNQALSKDISTRLFIPLGGFHYFTEMDRGPLIDLHFFHYDRSRDLNTPIDFCAGIPLYGQNVMHVCLMLAFYLGCNPIYFIGCDRDYWNMTREEYDTFFIEHFYEESGNNNKCLEHMPWELWLRCKERTERESVQLKTYATLRGFDVYNATAGGYFDTFPRAQYESLFVRSADFLGRGEQHAYEADAMNLAQSAVNLMNEGATGSALELLEVALCRNLNTSKKMDGLEYLMALCLSRLGAYDRAMIYAREDLARNVGNKDKSMLLIKQLEQYI
jgi:hypothetical protein